MILTAHRMVLRTARTWLAPLWAIGYALLARAWAAYLSLGHRGAAAYACGSLAAGEVVPGISDVDVAIVLPAHPVRSGSAADRVTGRWTWLRQRVPVSDLVLDYPLVLEEDELAQIADSCALTFGLDDGSAIYHGHRVSQDRMRMLERPGLYSSTGSWRRLYGPERRPHPRERSAAVRRIAAWLELCAWWQFAFPVCRDPTGPRTASLCVKLVSEPARILLWLREGRRVAKREDVLALARERFPEEREVIDAAAQLQRDLALSPEAPLAQMLPALLRLSVRITEHIEAEIADADVTEVCLLAAQEPELILPYGRWQPTDLLAGGATPPMIPLCDWRTLTAPTLPDECFALVPGDADDQTLLAAATANQTTHSPYPAFAAERLLVFPSPRPRARLRAIKSAFSDPASFALAHGEQVARFPDVPGFSAADVSARAVAEHRTWLRSPPRFEGTRAAAHELAMLLSAARVAVFAESLLGSTPVLPMTMGEVASALGGIVGTGLEHYRAFAQERATPPAELLASMRSAIGEFPAYA